MPNSTEKTAKKELGRTRSYAIIIYPDSANNEWLDILERTCIPCAISPLHDKDLEKDGTPKKPHYHVLFKFENKKSLKQIFEICE
ncbi:Rep family protein, partial [Helicobacter pylori]